MAYSVDLRQRVVDGVRVQKMTQSQAAECFSVGLATVKRWLKRGTELTPGKTGPKHPFTLNYTALQALVEANPDFYLDETAQQLNSSRSTVSYHLKKMGLTRKKNGTLPRKKRSPRQGI